MIYEFICCNQTFGSTSRAPHACPTCGLPMRRQFQFNIGNTEIVRDTHFNHTTGSVVSSDRDFRDQLARMSDARSTELGLAHDFQPIDYRDRAACGVSADDDVLDRIAKQKVDAGQQTLPTKTFS